MSAVIDFREEVQNPLDCVEDVLNTYNWAFDRANDDELLVKITGKNCDYRLFFMWQEDLKALQFCCQYDFQIKETNIPQSRKAAGKINEDLWIGHFDIPDETTIPSFRYTALLRGIDQFAGHEYVEDLVDISLAQCEKNFGIFNMFSKFEIANDELLDLALMETSGEA